MKKLTSLLLALLMVLSLAACGGGETQDESSAAELESMVSSQAEESKETVVKLTTANISNYVKIEGNFEYKVDNLGFLYKRDGALNYRIYPIVSGEFRNVQVTLGLSLKIGTNGYGEAPSNDSVIFSGGGQSLYYNELKQGKTIKFTTTLDASGNYSGKFDCEIMYEYSKITSTKLEYEVVSVSGEFVK